MPFGGETRQRERFGRGPVQWLFTTGHAAALFHEALELGMQIEVLGDTAEFFQQRRELLWREAGFGIVISWLRSAAVAFPDSIEAVWQDGLLGAARVTEILFEHLLLLLRDLVGFFARDFAELKQVFQVAVADRFALLDLRVKQRLRERRLVAFAVAEPPVAIHVNDHVLLEREAKIHRQLNAAGHGLGVLAVHVQDRRGQHFGHAGRIHRGAALGRRRGEAKLVVDEDMHGAADAVARQATEVERLLHDALADERSVAVDQQAHDLCAVFITRAILFRAHAAQHDGVDEFEVAGVEAKRQVNEAAGGSLVVAAVTQMVFHIAAAPVKVRVAVLELAEDLLRAFADDVGQHVQAAPVCHAENNFAHAVLAGALDGEVEQRNEAFAAFERKAFRADKLLAHELLEHDRIREPGKNAQLPLTRHRLPIGAAFDALLHPVPHLPVVDVQVLKADRPAVNLAQPADERAQREPAAGGHRLADEQLVHVGLAEPVVLRVQFRHLAGGLAERINFRLEVSAHTVGPDETIHSVLQQNHLRLSGPRSRRRRARRIKNAPVRE